MLISGIYWSWSSDSLKLSLCSDWPGLLWQLLDHPFLPEPSSLACLVHCWSLTETKDTANSTCTYSTDFTHTQTRFLFTSQFFQTKVRLLRVRPIPRSKHLKRLVANFYRPDALPVTQPAASQHLRLVQCTFSSQYSMSTQAINWSLITHLQGAMMLQTNQRHMNMNMFDQGLSRLLHDELHWLSVPEWVQYKMAVTVHRCLQNKAPRYLVPAFQSLTSPVDNICDLPVVAFWLYLVFDEKHSAVRPSLSGVRWLGIHYLTVFGIHRTAAVVSGVT